MSTMANNTRRKIDNSTSEFLFARTQKEHNLLSCFNNSLHHLLHPTCRHFETKRNSRLIGSHQDCTSHVISFIIGISVDRKWRKYWCVAHQCIHSIFRSRFTCSSRTTAFQHFVAFRETAHTRFPYFQFTPGEREWITRTRTPNCWKFSANFTDDAHELPSAQPEQLCIRSEVRL